MNRTNTILLLESDSAVAEKINNSLRNFGYTISHHSHKADIITLILNEKPNLILLEVREGEKLKDLETAALVYNNYQVPVIFLTSTEGKIVIERSKRLSLLSFVIKPILEKELISTVELTLFRHSMERKLMESERKYNELSNSIFQTIIECDLEGRLLNINSHGLEMFGLTLSEIEKGAFLNNFIRDNSCGSILEVSRQSAFIDAGNLDREFSLVNKFGKKYVIEELLTPVYTDYKLSGYRGVLIDVTNKKLKQSLCVTFNNVNYLYDRADADITEITGYVINELKEVLSDLDTIYFEDFSKNAVENSGDEIKHEKRSYFNGYTKFVYKS